jgi:hypothetical protein
MADQLVGKGSGYPSNAESEIGVFKRGEVIPFSQKSQEPLYFGLNHTFFNQGGRKRGIAPSCRKGNDVVRFGSVS